MEKWEDFKDFWGPGTKTARGYNTASKSHLSTSP